MAKSPNSGFTESEMAEMNTGDNESATVDTPAREEAPEPAPKERAPAESKTDAKPNGKAKEEAADGKADGKPPSGYVPHEALHEARKHAKEANERAQKVEQMWARMQQEANAARKQREEQQRTANMPDRETDPVGYLEYMQKDVARQLAEMKQTHEQRTEFERQQGVDRQMMDAYATNVRNFSRDAPDFNKAYEFLAQSRDEELIALGYDDPQERTNRLQYEEGLIVGRALMTGKSPAKLLYDYAVKRGWKNEAQQQPQQGETEESKLARLSKGQRAAKSLAGAKGEDPGDALTIEALTKLEGDAFDKQFDKMKRAGLLG